MTEGDRVPVLPGHVMGEALADLVAHVRSEGLDAVARESGVDLELLLGLCTAEVRIGERAHRRAEGVGLDGAVGLAAAHEGDFDEVRAVYDARLDKVEAAAVLRGTLLGLKLAGRMGARQ